MDDYEKLSDKLIFSILSGDNFDEESLREMEDLLAAKEAEEKTPSEKDITWKVAEDKQHLLDLAQGEYPPLFKEKIAADTDVFSNRVYSLAAPFLGGEVFFIPRPQELFIGDLSRAAHQVKKDQSGALEASPRSVDVLLEPEALEKMEALTDARKGNESFLKFNPPDHPPEPKVRRPPLPSKTKHETKHDASVRLVQSAFENVKQVVGFFKQLAFGPHSTRKQKK